MLALTLGCAPEPQRVDEQLALPGSWEQDLEDGRARWVQGDFVVTHAMPLAVVPGPENCEITLAATFALMGAVDGDADMVFDITHYEPTCGAPAYETFDAAGGWMGSLDGTETVGEVDFWGDIDPNRPVDKTARGLMLIDGDHASAALWLQGEAGVSGSYWGAVATHWW